MKIMDLEDGKKRTTYSVIKYSIDLNSNSLNVILPQYSSVVLKDLT